MEGCAHFHDLWDVIGISAIIHMCFIVSVLLPLAWSIDALWSVIMQYVALLASFCLWCNNIISHLYVVWRCRARERKQARFDILQIRSRDYAWVSASGSSIAAESGTSHYCDTRARCIILALAVCTVRIAEWKVNLQGTTAEHSELDRAVPGTFEKGWFITQRDDASPRDIADWRRACRGCVSNRTRRVRNRRTDTYSPLGLRC